MDKLMSLQSNVSLELLLLVIVADVMFGMIRAIVQGQFSPRIGLNGLIRKAAIILSMVFFALADDLININLVRFIPADILGLIGMNSVGMTEFMAIVCTSMELMSVFDNMNILGIPIPKWLINIMADTNKRIADIDINIEGQEVELKERQE